MVWNPPSWAGPIAPSWRRHAVLAVLAALAEAWIGAWLRGVPGLADAGPGRIAAWIAFLGCGLAARVVLSWRRDAAREKAAQESGTFFHGRLWNASIVPPVGPDNSWLAREGREWMENGTRAAAELRTALVTMAVLLPMLVWLAPWLALAVALCAWGLGWVAQKRSRAGKLLAEMEREETARDADAEEWAWRAMPEAAASGLGQDVAAEATRRGQIFARSRLGRGRTLLAWGMAGESAAHAGGWLLAAASLAAWKAGWLPAGNLAGFLGVSLLAYRPVREAGRLLPQLQKAQQVWLRLEELEASGRSRQATETDGPLEVVDLEAGWNPDDPVLHGVSFSVAPGSVVVATGSNGCGKSTLLAALSGSCPRVASRLGLPPQVVWMAQEPVLPPIPPAEWIGPPRGPGSELLFPNGVPTNLDWNEPIRKGGRELSRGERARLALLAACSRPEGLWLLDEPLSALPSDQRKRILSGILGARGKATVVLAEPTLPEGLAETRLLWAPAAGGRGPRIVQAGTAETAP